MVSFWKYAALSLAVASAMATAGEVEVHKFDSTESNAELRVIVEVGTSTICGYREAPHLIEHLVLTETKHGNTPPEIMLNLKQHGIKLEALTHPDFTEYKLTGPQSEFGRMTSIMADFMGASSLPRSGFEREKAVIVNEVRANPSYVSTATLYERFIGEHTEAPMPCESDAKKFMSYEYDEVNDLFKAFYQPENMKVIVSSANSDADLAPLVDAINGRPAASIGDTLNSKIGNRPQAVAYPMHLIGNNYEFALPIAGRMHLPADAVESLSESVRFELQNHVRLTQNLYTAQSFHSQSLHGGWIRFVIPNANPDSIDELKAVLENAIKNHARPHIGNDPIWKSYGQQTSSRPYGDLVVATKPHDPYEELLNELKALFF